MLGRHQKKLTIYSQKSTRLEVNAKILKCLEGCDHMSLEKKVCARTCDEGPLSVHLVNQGIAKGSLFCFVCVFVWFSRPTRRTKVFKCVCVCKQKPLRD